MMDCTDENLRKRVKHSNAPQPHLSDPATSTDCYNEVAKHGIIYQDGIIRQSWLSQQIWFSEFSPSPTDEVPTSSDIKSLERQLLQIKRRLWPAAEEAAAAYIGNGMHEGPYPCAPQVSAAQIFQAARNATNPMEILGEGRAGGLNKRFVNRSAIKLANLNASVGFALTDTPEPDTSNFHFVDLCAAPGGFSEYLVHHSEATLPDTTMIRGIGMSLIGTNEHGNGTTWKIDNCDTPRMQYRIFTGVDGTGDIYNWNNTLALSSEITGMPIHTVVCDGGVDAQRDHEHQEQLAQKLVLCQAAAALSLLSSGGSFVIKIFGCQTSAMRTMLKDLATRFDDFLITKPISSRPASAERYLVLVGFRGVPQDFDGRSWLNNMLLGRSPDSASKGSIETYMDSLDRKMLHLNIKACFAILSEMERIAEHLDEGCSNIQPRVDVGGYKRSWRL